ncbi:MAG TPA: intradiol ring-cleavage dioxygenase [Variovorax sp.]|nr:intradiol ring-cleavage dioxygenase [Variovorax sp.]
MRNINEHTITEAVLGSIDGCGDARLKEVISALVRHLHDFAREVKLTESEWEAGIRFLTATGQKCDDKRQEFILLSDTLGLSTLTVAQNHPVSAQATEATVFGPFYVEGAPRLPQGADISGGAPGELLFVRATVRGRGGEAVADATVNVWQADAQGLYDVQRDGLDQPQGRATLRTDGEGRLDFRSVMPVPYPIPVDGPVGTMLGALRRHPWRPAHVHFMIEAHGYQTLITHVFRGGDPYLDSDAVFGVRNSLTGDFRACPLGGQAPDGSRPAQPFHTLDFDFVLEPAAAP